MEFNHEELVDYYRSSAEYLLGAAKDSAKKGFVNNAEMFLNSAENLLSQDPKLMEFLSYINKNRENIMNTAYKNGIKFRLGGVIEAIKVIEDDNTRVENKEILVLNAFLWLKDAIGYAEKADVDIHETTDKLEENLNALGLQDYLSIQDKI